MLYFSTGTQAEFREKAAKMLSPEADITQDISFSGDTVTVVTTLPTKSVETKGKFGEKIPMTFLDGRQLEVRKSNLYYFFKHGQI